MKKKIDGKAIERVLNGIFNKMEQEHRALFLPIIKSSKLRLKEINDYKIFYLKFIYSYSNFLDVLIREAIFNDNDIEFIFKHSDFIEHHFQRIIQNSEGSPCYVDKSRTIMRRLVRWFLIKEEIVFDYKQEYTFHLPEKVFKTHDSIILFYEGLKHLYYGNPTQYLEAFKNLISNLNNGENKP